MAVKHYPLFDWNLDAIRNHFDALGGNSSEQLFYLMYLEKHIKDEIARAPLDEYDRPDYGGVLYWDILPEISEFCKNERELLESAIALGLTSDVIKPQQERQIHEVESHPPERIQWLGSEKKLRSLLKKLVDSEFLQEAARTDGFLMLFFQHDKEGSEQLSLPPDPQSPPYDGRIVWRGSLTDLVALYEALLTLELVALKSKKWRWLSTRFVLAEDGRCTEIQNGSASKIRYDLTLPRPTRQPSAPMRKILDSLLSGAVRKDRRVMDK